MSEAAYYRANLKRLPLGIVRRSSGLRGALVLLQNRVMPGAWYSPTLLPTNPTNVELADQDADPALAAFLSDHVDALRALGFQDVMLFWTPSLGPSRGLSRLMLAGDARSYAVVATAVTGPSIQTVIALTSRLDSGEILVTNNAVQRLPDVPGLQVQRRVGADAPSLVAAHAERLSQAAVVALDGSAARLLLRDVQRRIFEHYARIGLYELATEADLEAVRNGRPPGGRLQAPAVATLVPIVLLVGWILMRHFAAASQDTIDYNGSTIRLSHAYASYEDYKDDPENIAPAERPRVERLVATAPVARTFPDRMSMVRAAFELRFPGYGISPFGREPMAGFAIEIPYTSRDRVLVFREQQGRWTLVDDFVTSSSPFADVVSDGRDLVFHSRQGGEVLRRRPLPVPEQAR